MLCNGGNRPAQFMALKAAPLGNAADQWPQSGIVGVRDVRKQVMFDLVVQAAGKPGDEPR